MSIIYSPDFQRQIAAQYEYGSQRFGAATAARTYRRTISYIENNVQNYPRTGQWRPDIACFQTWVPKTPFVVFYRIAGPNLEVLAMFNGSQDYSGYTP